MGAAEDATQPQQIHQPLDNRTTAIPNLNRLDIVVHVEVSYGVPVLRISAPVYPSELKAQHSALAVSC